MTTILLGVAAVAPLVLLLVSLVHRRDSYRIIGGR